MRIDGHHAKGAGFTQRHFDACYGTPGSQGNVVGDQLCVVHFVNMVACKNQDVRGLVRKQYIQVLIDRISCAAVPGVLIDTLLRGQQVYELVELTAQK